MYCGPHLISGSPSVFNALNLNPFSMSVKLHLESPSKQGEGEVSRQMLVGMIKFTHTHMVM